MKTERFWLLAAVIAAHPRGQVCGRTRLQKTIKLLQSMGLETDYGYMLHFYGPYSEGLQAEIGLLEQMGLVIEDRLERKADDLPYFVIRAEPQAEIKEIADEFGEAIRLMAEAKVPVLELAATYVSFREWQMTHDKALEATMRKKASSCVGNNVEKALELLEKLNLTAA